jgi:hypothetical protein
MKLAKGRGRCPNRVASPLLRGSEQRTRFDVGTKKYLLQEQWEAVMETTKARIYSNVEEMFDAIRGEDGVLHPTQFMSSGQRFIHLADPPEAPHCNPGTSTTPPAGK